MTRKRFYVIKIEILGRRTDSFASFCVLKKLMTKKNIPRIFLGKEFPNLPQLDLTIVQKESWLWFLNEGIKEAIAEISSIEDFTGKNWLLELGEHKIIPSSLTPSGAKRKGLTYQASLSIKATLTNKQTGKKIAQEVFLGEIPQMTTEGTFIINGIERVVVNQIVRSPGVFFTGDIDPVTGRMLYMAEIRPNRGSWLEFFVSRNDIISVRIDRRRKFPVTTFLRAIGVATDEELLQAFSSVEKKERSFITATLEKDPTKTREEALAEIYRKMRPGEPVVLENAKDLIYNMFFNLRRYDLGKVGRYKINKRLDLSLPNSQENWVLRPEDVMATIAYLINLQNGEGRVDDIDHLANRRVRRVGELVCQTAFRVGLLRLERAIKEKMSLISVEEEIRPVNLINARPVISAINEFFRSNQLSAILDQINPLSEIDNLRRLSVLGQGGITRERASFSIRDINSSQYGRICPIRSPEGPNIGLVTYMALYTRVNEYGFLEVPYRRVVKEERKQNGKKAIRMRATEEIVYLQADDEEEYYITHAGINLDKNNYILDRWVPVRFKGEFLEAPVENIAFMDLAPRQIVGSSGALIPFLSHDEANRALMGSHMQCQAVPLVSPEVPLIGTGVEDIVALSMSRIITARHSGTVKYVDAEKIIIRLDQKSKEKLEERENIKIEGNEEIYILFKFEKTSPSSTCYNQRPMVNPGQKVKAGDLLADGPATDQGKVSLGKNLLIAYCAFEGLGFEDAIVVSDRLVKEDVLTSITIESHEASVVETKLGPEELTRDIPNVSETDLANLAEDGIIVVGSEVGPNDILVGKIAPRGETELTAEEKLLRAIFGEKAREVRDTCLRMPHGERGIVIDVQILDREKGDELEPGTNKKVIIKVAQIRKVVVGDKLAGRHGNKGVISKIVPEADMPHLNDGTPIDIIISPLSVLSRMNLGQLMEASLGLAAQRLGQAFDTPIFEEIPEEKINQILEEAGLPISGKMILYDGRTGEPFDQPVTIGIAYIMKLIHMVEDKTHARSTGPYSLVTQQPLGGKAQMGGQRLGEMEVWALESHRAAHTLQEMLTIKSDDVVGRGKAFEAIVKGVDIPQASIPESFKVLAKELNSLCLSVIPTGVVAKKEKMEISSEKEGQELAVAAGAETVVEGMPVTEGE